MHAEGTGWIEAAAGGGRGRARPLRWLRRPLQAMALSLGLGAGALGAYCGVVVYEGNFHAVDNGVLYRSAQPGARALQAAAEQYGIKSVLNLRGAHAGEGWYDEEVGASRALGLAHYDYALSAKRRVTAPQMAEIIAILRDAPKPLLIHCKSGADRAGLVAALYRFAIDGASAADADRQLSILYGHFPYLTSRSGAMDDSFRAFVQAAAAK